MPKYRKHSSRNQAFLELNGHRTYLGRWRSPESIALYKQLVARHLAGDTLLATAAPQPLALPPEPTPELEAQPAITVAELAERYREYAAVYYRKNGKPTREAELVVEALACAVDILGDADAEDFGPACLLEVRQLMIDRGWTRGYVNRQIGRIKRAFKHAVAREWISKSPKVAALADVESLAKGRTEAPDNPKVESVPNDVVDATLTQLPEVVADMVTFQRLTGCRPGELVVMTPGAIDRSGDIWIYMVDGHKMDHKERPRVVAIGERAQRILSPYLLRGDREMCFSPADSERRRREVLHSNRRTPPQQGNRPGTNKSKSPKRPAGRAYTVGSYRRAIHRACDKAGVERWNPHRLRHTAASETRKRMGLDASQAMLGHKHANMAEHYAQLERKAAIEVARKVG